MQALHGAGAWFYLSLALFVALLWGHVFPWIWPYVKKLFGLVGIIGVVFTIGSAIGAGTHMTSFTIVSDSEKPDRWEVHQVLCCYGDRLMGFYDPGHYPMLAILSKIMREFLMDYELPYYNTQYATSCLQWNPAYRKHPKKYCDNIMIAERSRLFTYSSPTPESDGYVPYSKGWFDTHCANDSNCKPLDWSAPNVPYSQDAHWSLLNIQRGILKRTSAFLFTTADMTDESFQLPSFLLSIWNGALYAGTSIFKINIMNYVGECLAFYEHVRSLKHEYERTKGIFVPTCVSQGICGFNGTDLVLNFTTTATTITPQQQETAKTE